MQLSFPSVPNDSAAGATPVSGPAVADGTPDSNAAGFAQLLAGIGSPVSTAVPTAPGIFDGSFSILDAGPALEAPGDASGSASAVLTPCNSVVGTITVAGPGPSMATGAFLPNFFSTSNPATNWSGLKAPAGALGKTGLTSPPRLASKDPVDLTDQQTVAAVLAQISGAGVVPVQLVAAPAAETVDSTDATTIATAFPAGSGWTSGRTNVAARSQLPISGPTVLPGQVASAQSPTSFPGVRAAVISNPSMMTAVDPRAADGQIETGRDTAPVPAAPASSGGSGSSGLLGPSPEAKITTAPESVALAAGTDGTTSAGPGAGAADATHLGADPRSVAQPEAVGTTSASAMANFAAANGLPLDGINIGEKGLAKSTLASPRQKDTQVDPVLGIDSASRSATMPAGQPFAHSTTSETTAVANATSVTDARGQQDALPQPVALPSTAHRAVEAALSVAERFSGRDQHSVNLQFSVGGSDLNVRVELRGGEVHTTFRTDSAELRSALSNEWNAVTSQSGSDRTSRLATPVFTSSDAGNSFSGDTSRQRDPEQRGSSGGTFSSGAPRGTTTTAAATAGPVISTTQTPVSSVHLHTLA